MSVIHDHWRGWFERGVFFTQKDVCRYVYIQETIPQYPFGLLAQYYLFIEQTGKASQFTTFVA